jgi:hypothetical protein
MFGNIYKHIQDEIKDKNIKKSYNGPNFAKNRFVLYKKSDESELGAAESKKNVEEEPPVTER